MILNIKDMYRSLSAGRWIALLTGAAMVCMIALATHVHVMNALKVSAHLLSIRMERSTGCDQYQRILDAAGQGAHSAVEAYIHVCVETSGSTDRRSYSLMMDLEQSWH